MFIEERESAAGGAVTLLLALSSRSWRTDRREGAVLVLLIVVVIDSRGVAEAVSGQVVEIAISRVLSGSEGAVNGCVSSSFNYNNESARDLLHFGRRRGGIWSVPAGKTTPARVQTIDKMCSFWG